MAGQVLAGCDSRHSPKGFRTSLSASALVPRRHGAQWSPADAPRFLVDDRLAPNRHTADVSAFSWPKAADAVPLINADLLVIPAIEATAGAYQST